MAGAKTTAAVGDDKKKSTTVSFYEKEENLNKLCDFLRSKNGPPVREAIETKTEKRCYYLKGEKLVNFLVEPKKGVKWPAKLPRIKDRQEAITICKSLCELQYIMRSEKEGKGEVTFMRVRDFEETGYFTWIYEGNQSFSHMMSGLLIVGFLCCVCFPIWPTFLRVFVWYMSVTFLLLIFFLIVTRASLFLFVWILGFDFWFLPNLFDEQLGFVDSFKPLYSFERTKSGQLYYRIGIAVAFFSFCYWAVTQPSEFDDFVVAQGDFIKDLYSGKLLSDVSQTEKENIDKPKMPTLADLLKKLDASSDDEDDPLKEAETEQSEEDKLDSMLDSLMNDSEDVSDEE